eukprot:12655634-Heterocapsa_arctica.AAC.1
MGILRPCQVGPVRFARSKGKAGRAATRGETRGRRPRRTRAALPGTAGPREGTETEEETRHRH